MKKKKIKHNPSFCPNESCIKEECFRFRLQNALGRFTHINHLTEEELIEKNKQFLKPYHQWVSVKDQLPDVSKCRRREVIVFGSQFDDGEMCIIYSDAYYMNNKFYFFYKPCCKEENSPCKMDCESNTTDIIHPLFWMYIPQPPTEEEFEESFGPRKEYVKTLK